MPLQKIVKVGLSGRGGYGDLSAREKDWMGPSARLG